MADSTIPATTPRHPDLTCQVFGRLTVIGSTTRRQKKKVLWMCRCVCGEITYVVRDRLRRGTTRSCGCLQREQRAINRRAAITHGQSLTKEYGVWGDMLGRCRTKTHHAWSNYGGRGITVCERWLCFENFYADMCPRPSDKHTLDRRDNDLGYSPENCRWIVHKEQQRNRGNNRRLTFNGETMCIIEWSEKTGLPKYVILNRLKLGWPIELVLTVPVGRANRYLMKRTIHPNRMLTLHGETLSADDWAVRTGVNAVCILVRIHRGWTVERALTTPQSPWTRRSNS